MWIKLYKHLAFCKRVWRVYYFLLFLGSLWYILLHIATYFLPFTKNPSIKRLLHLFPCHETISFPFQLYLFVFLVNFKFESLPKITMYLELDAEWKRELKKFIKHFLIEHILQENWYLSLSGIVIIVFSCFSWLSFSAEINDTVKQTKNNNKQKQLVKTKPELP